MTDPISEPLNINQREIEKRRIQGIIMGITAVALALILIMSGASREWRLLFLLPAFAAALGFLQASHST